MSPAIWVRTSESPDVWVSDGMSRADAAALFGVSRKLLSKWLRKLNSVKKEIK